MRSEQLRSTTNELHSSHALAACWRHLQEWERAVSEPEEQGSLMKDEVASLYLNVAPRLPDLIQDQPLERGGNAHPDAWPRAICAPGAIRVISGEGGVD
jgi:hypothetical protein